MPKLISLARWGDEAVLTKDIKSSALEEFRESDSDGNNIFHAILQRKNEKIITVVMNGINQRCSFNAQLFFDLLMQENKRRERPLVLAKTSPFGSLFIEIVTQVESFFRTSVDKDASLLKLFRKEASLLKKNARYPPPTPCPSPDSVSDNPCSWFSPREKRGIPHSQSYYGDQAGGLCALIGNEEEPVAFLRRSVTSLVIQGFEK